MMHYVGLGLLFLGCALLCTQFSAYQQKRLLEYEGLLRLLKHMRSEVMLYLRPFPECVLDFKNEALQKTGFLDALKDYKTPADAWEATHQNFSINGELCKEFYTFCKNFGKGYAENECKLLESYIEKFEKSMENERKEAPRTAKLVRTLIASGGCAVAVLLL